MCLSMAALVTFYSYNLLSLVLEDHARRGMRQLHFRDMAHDILGIVITSFIYILQSVQQTTIKSIRT